MFQHGFIKDATSMKPLRDLICEVKAEVIVEERETDDVEIKVCVVYTVAMAIGTWVFCFFIDKTCRCLFDRTKETFFNFTTV